TLGDLAEYGEKKNIVINLENDVPVGEGPFFLHDAVVRLGCAHHLPALPPEMRAWLFDVDVFARLAGPNRYQRMPVIRRGDRNSVDGFVFHNAARIGIDL